MQHAGLIWIYEQLDASRRLLGASVDALGVNPSQHPYRVALNEPCLTLRAYGGQISCSGPAMLLLPAPIKSARIWDLAPWASVVGRCIDSGFRVYLTQWDPPGNRGRRCGLADYAHRLLLDCLDTIRAETGQGAAFIIAHSLGGTCAAVFSALEPARIRGLVLLGAPLCFGRDVGMFGPLVAATPPIRTLTPRPTNVPGSLLNSLCLMASPITFEVARWLDLLGSLNDYRALCTHFLVERWTLDETPLSERLYEDVLEWLYRENRFMRGSLRIGRRCARPRQVVAPLLSVVDRRCGIAPPEAVVPFHRAVGSTDTTVLCYPGDTGISLQHVGMLVGSNAHRDLWPAIIEWARMR